MIGWLDAEKNPSYECPIKWESPYMFHCIFSFDRYISWYLMIKSAFAVLPTVDSQIFLGSHCLAVTPSTSPGLKSAISQMGVSMAIRVVPLWRNGPPPNRWGSTSRATATDEANICWVWSPWTSSGMHPGRPRVAVRGAVRGAKRGKSVVDGFDDGFTKALFFFKDFIVVYF